MKDCELVVQISRVDYGHLPHILPHLSKVNNYSFSKRILQLDPSAPKTNFFLTRPGIGTLDQVLALSKRLISDGHYDELRILDLESSDVVKINQKFFGTPQNRSRDYRGGPFYVYAKAIDCCESPYLLYFDSDMMIHQRSNFSWINEGIEILKKNQDIICVNPQAGPPREDQRIFRRYKYYRNPNETFYRFFEFTTRVYLIDRARFMNILPLQASYYYYLKLLIKRLLKREVKYFVPPFEDFVSSTLEKKRFYRVDLISETSWSLHPNYRGDDFLSILPNLLKSIEAGAFPESQRGHHNVMSNDWSAFLKQT